MKTEDSDVYRSLPSLQSRGFIESLGSVGVTTSDDFLHHTGWDSKSSTKRFANWIDDPLEILSLYREAAHAACRLRIVQHDRGLGNHQMFYGHSYRLPTFTDGNAPRPVKRVLRGTWTHDTIIVTVGLVDEAKSVQAMETAMALLATEHRNTIDEQRPLYNQFIQAMETKFFLWSQRVKKFHQGLIRVVLVSYRKEFEDVRSHLDQVRDRLLLDMSHGISGDTVVDAVVRMMGDIEFDDVELTCRSKGELRPGTLLGKTIVRCDPPKDDIHTVVTKQKGEIIQAA
ncbi:hypothetical protein E4T38_03044 [Aureobasidium subglaciale]|nr:hypothetical protein E4T38_03044 [Aureobasidium subglaciale]KAI5226956.1 hypothetical protein E4T40_02818 [Aureobasidium subglaciale]KAI5230132.1 hypothetical protein E4T41_03041 [Aureobasidium subglaciale]KAI5264721.1 hypothetical protein E4T46_02819 [Aureobasidium subglaciale]